VPQIPIEVYLNHQAHTLLNHTLTEQLLKQDNTTQREEAKHPQIETHNAKLCAIDVFQ
jgi:hypothetical protein